MRRKTISVLAGLVSAACGGSSLDVGGDGSSGGTAGTHSNPPPNGPPLPDWGSLRECEPTDDDGPVVGSWDGAMEDFYFEPLLRVRLVIQSATEDSLCGHVVLGEDGAAPPAATDPEVDYPPGVDTEFGVHDGPPPPIEGVRYTILAGGARDGVVRFRTSWSEPYEEYCALQTPLYDWFVERWQCMPWGTGGIHVNNATQECTVSTTTSSVTTSITQCAACLNPLCLCNETGCTANLEPEQTFDLSLDENGEVPVLTGDGVDYPYSNLTLRLARVE